MPNSSSTENTLPPELATLSAEALALESETAPAQIGEDGKLVEAPAPIDYASEATTMVNFAADSLAVFYPSTKDVLTEEKRAGIAAAAVPVLEKYGFSMGTLFGKYGAELNLAFQVAMIAPALVTAIRADREAEQEKAGTATPKPAVKGAQQPVIEKTDPNSLHTRA